MKVAAIDLGSNSIHLVVAEVAGSGAFRVLGREKEMVRLGAGTFTRHALSEATVERGLATLRRFHRLTRNHGVEKVIAVATAAVREAENGQAFLDEVGREIGVWPRVLSGQEEARLIYLSVRHSINLAGRRALVVDIGGGSLEMALGAGPVPEWTASEKLGVLRMTERFLRDDPLPADQEHQLEQHVRRALSPHAERLRRAGLDVVVGTSGTILALGGLARSREAGDEPEALHHVTLRAEAVRSLRGLLVQTDAKARLKLPWIGRARADIIVAGAVVLDTLLQACGAREILLCEWSLREGALLDFIQSHPRWLATADSYPDARRRSVVDLAARCGDDTVHAAQVAELSLKLFDGLQARHRLGARERELLEYAALLHDIGHHISYPSHHKHSYYLIKEGGLLGFDPQEIEVVANIARYHRRARPSKRHLGYASLPGPLRRRVRVLSALLRLAEALDRSHRQVVRGLLVRDEGTALHVYCELVGDGELELWNAAGRTEPLEEELRATVRIEAVAGRRPVPLGERPASAEEGAVSVRSSKGHAERSP